MGTLLRLAGLVCVLCMFHVQATVLNVYPPSGTQWYEVDADVPLMCKWEHDSSSRVQITWKNAERAGLRRIVENDTVSSYVYQESSPPESRQMEEHDFGDSTVEPGTLKEQYSELTIRNITLTDSRMYFCNIEIGAGEKENNVKFEIGLYAIPTVTTADNTVTVDVRAEIEVEEETTTAETTTEVASSNDTNAYDDEQDDYYYQQDEPATGSEKIIIECPFEGAYPRPDVYFRVAEGAPIPATKVNWTSGSDTSLYSGKGILELDADPQYDGKSVSCFVQLPTQPEATEVNSDNTSSPITILHEVSQVTTTIVPKVAIAGESVEIRCASDGNPKPTFTVKSENSADPTYDVNYDGTTFTISSVAKEHAGNYYCVATLPSRTDDDSEAETLASEVEELEVQYIEAPTLSDSSKIVLSLGASKVVTCTGSGNPATITRWKKDGNVFETGTLNIDNANYDDAGTYTCETSNAAGTRNANIEISVEGACVGSFKETVVSDSAIGENLYYVKLECEVTGQPECTVDIVSQPGFELSGTKKNNGRVLEYEAMPKLASPVTFFCLSHNSVGNSNVSTTIGSNTIACCAEASTAGLSVGAIIGIILLVLVVVIGIPVACYFVKKRNAKPDKKAPEDAEAAEPEKEGLNKDASSEV